VPKRSASGAAILASVERRLVPADSPFAPTVGYSRAVRVGDQIHVAGTAAVMPYGAPPPTGAYGQARRCLEIIVEALAELGARPEHVVRTRVYITSEEDWEEVGRAHGEVFGEIRRASAMLVITGLLDPRFLVEIEADALVPV
jgi:enamine deaminase RidA (YjgF/YER057c/UK114 family)